ncbi:MAG: hypothetical protein A2X50_00370 [Candidatus Rokubacteria bacterium GWF2_70_14]|nr:MAG: hypothetical protein A2X50_00370 [Candidatus Rokubacteria bacterium GWF2_70_14]
MTTVACSATRHLLLEFLRIVLYLHRQGEMLARLGQRPAGLEPGQSISPHGLAVDSRGDIYVGEVSFTNWGNRYKGPPHPPGLRSLQKLVKVR